MAKPSDAPTRSSNLKLKSALAMQLEFMLYLQRGHNARKEASASCVPQLGESLALAVVGEGRKEARGRMVNSEGRPSVVGRA